MASKEDIVAAAFPQYERGSKSFMFYVARINAPKVVEYAKADKSGIGVAGVGAFTASPAQRKRIRAVLGGLPAGLPDAAGPALAGVALLGAAAIGAAFFMGARK